LSKIDSDLKTACEELENREFDKIIEKLNIQKSEFVCDDNICFICYSDDYNFLTSCHHTFCFDCFMASYIVHKKTICSYCTRNIDIEKCYFAV